MPSITGLATTVALIAVENKIPEVSNLVKKTNYGAKISDIETKYFTKLHCNKFTRNILDGKIKVKELIEKSAIAGFINNADLNKKEATLATKGELKVEKDKIIKLETFDSGYFCLKSYFKDDGTQNYLVF